MAKREVKVAFEIAEGIITAGTVKVLVSLGKGTGTDKVVFCKDMEHYLDYTGVSISDLVDSAVGNDIISLQNSVWRDLGSAVTQEAGKTTKMAEWHAREITRAGFDPAKAILNKAAKGDLAGEELAALIKQLQDIAKK